MTNDEAIKLLSQIMDVLLASNSWLPSTKNPIKESFGMAIDALTAQPETHGVCLDVIDRQAAIRWVKTECNPYGKPTLDFESGKKVIEHLKQMPSAQRTGRWIHDGCQFKGGIDWMHCSECGHKDNWNAVRTPFCAWCGARMEENNESD